jgi:hypothetical protein
VISAEEFLHHEQCSLESGSGCIPRSGVNEKIVTTVQKANYKRTKSSGSDPHLEKFLVPVPVAASVAAPDPDLFSTVFQHQKLCTKSCPFNDRSDIGSRKVGI